MEEITPKQLMADIQENGREIQDQDMEKEEA